MQLTCGGRGEGEDKLSDHEPKKYFYKTNNLKRPPAIGCIYTFELYKHLHICMIRVIDISTWFF